MVSDSDLVYLRPNVVAQPLVDQWYAWAYLIPPATAAMMLAGRHLKLMDSYVSAPQVHAASVQNPAMAGGPFVDFGGGRVDEVRELRDRLRRERADHVDLAYAIKQLDDLLREQADGHALAALYDRVPEMLRGYVELVYDLNNQPSFRLVEPLLYRSPYYHREAQTVMLSLLDGDDRPFIFSTPILEEADRLHVRIPFDSPRWDALFATTASPRPFGEIRELIDVSAGGDELLATLVTDEKPAAYDRYDGAGLRWRYFGHGCVLLESAATAVLVDPVLSYTYENDISRYTYEDLPARIECILITHNHQDHVLLETLLQLRHKTDLIVVPRNGPAGLQDPSLKLMLEQIGFANVIAVDEFDRVELDAATVECVPFFGEHGDLDIRTKMAYVLRIAGRSVLFAADSCNVEPRLYEHVQRVVGDIDALFVGMECEGAPMTWMYGPLLTAPLKRSMDRSRGLSGSDYEQAKRMVDCFSPRDVYVYAMGQEPWLRYISTKIYTETSRPIVESDRLIAECAGRGLAAERLFGEKEILLPAAPEPA